MKQMEYSNSFQNLKKIVFLFKRNSKYMYQCQTENFYVKKEVVSIPQKRDYPDEYLKVFWLYLKECFFRQPQEQELLILSHFITNQNNIKKFEYWDEEEEKKFEHEIQNVFSESYLKQPITNIIATLNRRNWLEYNFFICKSNLECKKQKCKVIQLNKKIKQSRDFQASAYNKLKKEQRILDSFIASQQEKSLQISRIYEIQYQIDRLQIQRSKVAHSNKQILQKVKQKINSQVTLLTSNRQLTKEMIFKRDLSISELVFNIEYQLKYLNLQVNLLEKKQIAQSFSKLIKIQRIDEKLVYSVAFQEALNLKCQKYDQNAYHYFNNLRDISLQKCYFVGWKSKYNYVSQNLYNFSNIVTHRTQREKNGVICVGKQIVDTFVLGEFQGMQICHQCKCFYKKQRMRKCAYNSLQFDKPCAKPVAFDSFITEIHKNLNKNDKQNLEQKISRDCYFRYKFQKNVYSCNRYYCNLCMKAYNFDKKIQLCPFCVGVCQCSRCIRNFNIFKLKTIFLRLCGNLQELQQFSQYKQFIQLHDMNEETQNILDECQGSEQKRIISKSHSVSYDYKCMKMCQKQILRLSTLIYMTLKRQKLKRKLVKSRQTIFKQELKKIQNSNIYQADIKRLLN